MTNNESIDYLSGNISASTHQCLYKSSIISHYSFIRAQIFSMPLSNTSVSFDFYRNVFSVLHYLSVNKCHNICLNSKAKQSYYKNILNSLNEILSSFKTSNPELKKKTTSNQETWIHFYSMTQQRVVIQSDDLCSYCMVPLSGIWLSLSFHNLQTDGIQDLQEQQTTRRQSSIQTLSITKWNHICGAFFIAT